ncbi:hypothetical protein [Lactobacillus acetotolerans]|jgi:hypothetical protein|uniref:2TM domain-containing protein n=1 Tax=Lactobacillus acetotolerans TaxID=1600 RepID=A0A5P5ZIE5_9LACO|nr:hypothetical protein [Lactobacillus acetotolerans]KRN36359.1 hypothetical protein FC77_GL001430 [Lactobacillus acetotolerans DSM 20749 = JCM 3825]QFG51193.1 hypothetical protein LA749_03955 [Lactobacillus acetotolerans]QJD73499.1 hypothetical protein HG715_06075 [Lactobacillus acetotolerans]GGV19046.1 hypothetical protein GCM10011628_15120 [Lactobacillus acetotolerans DSM 20749 = JCM 3825]
MGNARKLRKVIYSGIIFLITIILFITSIVLAKMLNPMFWWGAIGMAFVTWGILDWHISFIRAYKKSKKK